MSKRIFTYPVEFFTNSTNPKQPAVFEAAQKFCEAQFGGRLDMSSASVKVWVVIKTDDVGDGFRVIGISQMRRVLDIPTFHVEKPDETLTGEAYEAAKMEVRTARDQLTGRMWGYAQDQFCTGQPVFVFIDPAAERFWKGYLKLIGAEPAHRFILNV
jgi:hypothetical protein